jgi:hypothetical protein
LSGNPVDLSAIDYWDIAMGSSSSNPIVVHNRKELFAGLARAATIDDVRRCLRSYTPPSERLIIRAAADFEKLGTTKEAVQGACDTSFWAYGDFESVYASFSLADTNKERRVMGIEGIGTPEALAAVIASGEKSLKIGHLSLLMMNGKVANGEWRWIDEARCMMHTATPKPALLRTSLRDELGVELKVVRHEEFAGGAESAGDLIIFDMDKADVRKETGNTKIFCQDPKNYAIAEFGSLSDEMQAAVSEMLRLEFLVS